MFRKAAIAMILPVASYGAACSTTGTGPAAWSDASAWTNCGGAVPGNGDTATVTRPLTVSGNVNLGVSPATAGTPAITTSGAGAVKVATGAVLTLKGSFTYANPTVAGTRVLELEPGATLRLSAAENPAAQYYIEPSSNGTRGNALFYFACTPSQPCLVEGDVAGGALPPGFWNTPGGTGPLNIVHAEWVTFRNWGSATVTGFRAFAGTATGSSVHFHFLNCVFDNVGRIEISSINTGNSVRLEDSRFVNSPALTGHLGFQPDEPAGSGVRSIQRNWFERSMHQGVNGTFSGFLIQHNILMSGTGFSITNPAEIPEFLENYIERDGSPSNSFRGNVRNNYIINTAATGNPHFIAPANSAVQQTIEGNVFDALSPTALEGNCLSNNTANGALRHRIQFNVVTISRNPTRAGSCALLSTASQQTATQVEVANNSMVGGGRFLSALLTGEGGPGQATGYVRLFQNNLWNNMSTASTPGGYSDYGGGSPTCLTNDNVIDPAAATNNASIRAKAFSPAEFPCLAGKTNTLVRGHFWPTSGGTPGASDLVDVEPGFADAGRNVQTYLAMKGVAWVDASTARAYLAADPAVRIPELVRWVKQGFAPRNIRYATAGAGGGYIGAVRPAINGAIF